MGPGEDFGQARTGPGAVGYAGLFVGAVWAGMLLAALGFVWVYATDVPFWPDEWMYVPVLTGNEPLNLDWLWRQHLEHRIPLPKLLWVGLLGLTGFDFRAVMFCNTLALGGLALALILAARQLRGRASYADAFFPLLLLHWGHWENLLWAWQVQFISSTVLAGLLLVIIVRNPQPLRWGATCLAGTCLLLLALCGANGLVFVPPLAMWLVLSGGLRLCQSRGSGGILNGLLALAFALAALLLVALYFVGYEKPTERQAGHNLRVTLQGAVRFLGTALGHGPEPSGDFYSGILVVGIMGASAVLLALAIGLRPRDWLRTVGLFLFLVSLAGLAGGIGWSREAMYARYVTLAAPVLCGAYFSAEVCGVRYLDRAVQFGLLALLAAVLPFNVQEGLKKGEERYKVLRAFERDMEAGAPLHQVAEVHYRDVLWQDGGVSTEQGFATYLIMLNEAGIAPYCRMRRDRAAEKALADETRPKDIAYRVMIKHVQKTVGDKVPSTATVVVVNYGDDDLLQLGGRRAWPFPQADDGSYAKYTPDDEDAVRRLRGLPFLGAQFIVFPQPALWFLEGKYPYPKLRQYLEDQCERIHEDEHCVIFRLSARLAPKAKKSGAKNKAR
jgi:hypothetical protein